MAWQKPRCLKLPRGSKWPRGFTRPRAHPTAEDKQPPHVSHETHTFLIHPMSRRCHCCEDVLSRTHRSTAKNSGARQNIQDQCRPQGHRIPQESSRPARQTSTAALVVWQSTGAHRHNFPVRNDAGALDSPRRVRSPSRALRCWHMFGAYTSQGFIGLGIHPMGQSNRRSGRTTQLIAQKDEQHISKVLWETTPFLTLCCSIGREH